MKRERAKIRGTQIILCPIGAIDENGEPITDHPGVQYGFVTGYSELLNHVFIRLWKGRPVDGEQPELRTPNSSLVMPYDKVFPFTSTTYDNVSQAFKEFVEPAEKAINWAWPPGKRGQHKNNEGPWQ